MNKFCHTIVCSLLMIMMMTTGCASSDPKDVKREIAGEQKSIQTAKAFISDILDYNKDNDTDLTLIHEYTDFWEYLKKAGLTKELSTTILSAHHYGDSEWRIIERFYAEQLKPLINYLYGYEMDDFLFSFDEFLGGVEVRIKPESIDKGIYLLNDPSEPAFVIFVERVEKEGVKVVSVSTRLPLAMDNKYQWVQKHALPNYLLQVKAQIEEEKIALEKQKQQQEREEAEEAARRAQLQAQWEEEEKRLEQERKEQELRLENRRKTEEKCSVENKYEDALVSFIYDGCTVVTGSLELNNEMKITREANEYDTFGEPFSIEIKAWENSDNISFYDYDFDQYDWSVSSLFGEYGFVAKTNINSSGDSSEFFEGIIDGGNIMVTVELKYMGEIRPHRAHLLLFNSLYFK